MSRSKETCLASLLLCATGLRREGDEGAEGRLSGQVVAMLLSGVGPVPLEVTMVVEGSPSRGDVGLLLFGVVLGGEGSGSFWRR